MGVQLPPPSVAANRATASRRRVESIAVGIAVWLVYFLPRPDPLANLGARYDDDRILLEYGAGYDPRTGRRTVIAVPEDGGVGRVGSIDRPGTYFSQRILEDTATLIVNHGPAGLNGVLISASLARIAEAYPRVLQAETPLPNAGDSVPPAYYRVVRDETCLRSLAGR